MPPLLIALLILAAIHLAGALALCLIAELELRAAECSGAQTPAPRPRAGQASRP